MKEKKRKAKLLLVGGARPNFMKIAPLWHRLNRKREIFQLKIVHTGQHYDYKMSRVFFDELGLPEPDFFLDVGSGSHAYQTAQVMIRFEEIVLKTRPDMVMVVGDVNSTIAASLTAVKLNVPTAHVEAGLRSFDRTMPEEINRILTDHIAELLLVSEPSGVENLTNEGIDSSKIHLVGNTMIDSLTANLSRIDNSRIREELGLTPGEYGTITMHRPANIDDIRSLHKVFAVLREAANRNRVVFPIHPRTLKSIETHGLKKEIDSIKNLEVIKPLGYFDFMNLVKQAKYVLTDSGGVQEETTWLGVPCITLREGTERPLTVTHGTNQITGLSIKKITAALDRAETFDRHNYSPPDLWDGQAAARIEDVIEQYFGLFI